MKASLADVLSAHWFGRFCKRFNRQVLDGSCVDWASSYQCLALNCSLAKTQARVVLQAWKDEGLIELVNGQGVRVLRPPAELEVVQA